MKLNDLGPLMARRQDGRLSFDRFRSDPALAALHWPDDVLEQFLFEHGDNGAFVHDYGTIDLRHITWQLETIPAADFHTMPTGKTHAGCIESYAAHPVHWVAVRPPEVGRHWEEHGTWLRPPLLIDRRLLDPADNGLQVLEGRTRVGVLRGRAREQLRVALNHHAWVGRP
ncbi:hypothetical protein OG245_37645 (plasmid) [Streptomyces sp. NBC_01116]|uniref:hypothetical protein n=1 Tax=Streptomyces sp. NBC_01116 TaxID=2903752 RepID=UPI002F90D796